MHHTLGTSIYPAHHTTCLAYLAQRRDHNHCFFRNLHRMHFTAPGLLKAVSALGYFCSGKAISNPLRSSSLIFALPMREAFSALHESFCARNDVNSQVLHTNVGVLLPPIRRQAQRSERFVIDEWVLGTIFAFTNLIKFKLTPKAAFALNDLHMKEMAAAWPRRLRSLWLGSLSAWVQPFDPPSSGWMSRVGMSIDVTPTSLPLHSMDTPCKFCN
ncbi:hypothetical protein K443DRAFT_477099 [Laccaria amethystina LaAM-08-1]|uniref:Uncharacterized protein n=1 Tax=Laccaria amethystina LaAM-08-1 TaxID=1095629 RepID=A0A0C9Y0E3_9AGAR|nr:hypothetical protein K443DRAFT_477099 [Laccaria amethystina LaAM-08-1]